MRANGRPGFKITDGLLFFSDPENRCSMYAGRGIVNHSGNIRVSMGPGRFGPSRQDAVKKIDK